MMRMLLATTLLGLLVVGCANTAITNLTPSHYPRNDAGVYTVEVELDTHQQTVQHHSLTPSVVVGMNSYPMRRTLKTENRWEGSVPVARGQENVQYHFKFDFDYNRFGTPGRDSKLSPQYELQITNP